jgi:hypothetical protein
MTNKQTTHPETIMTDNNFTTTFTVDQSVDEAFAAITNVRGWWSEDAEGSTDTLGAEFIYEHGDLHRSTQKITELVPGKRVVWHVLDGYLGFVQDATEWKGTDIAFDISEKGDKTEVRFTHVGLVPDAECFDDCSNAWGFFVGSSLRSLITTGRGQPIAKDEN